MFFEAIVDCTKHHVHPSRIVESFFDTLQKHKESRINILQIYLQDKFDDALQNTSDMVACKSNDPFPCLQYQCKSHTSWIHYAHHDIQGYTPTSAGANTQLGCTRVPAHAVRACHAKDFTR